MTVECDVYKSLKKEGYYLYVKTGEGLEAVPIELMNQFGDGELTLTFTLSKGRTLAKEDAAAVLANLELQGYHLQLPPADLRFSRP